MNLREFLAGLMYGRTSRGDAARSARKTTATAGLVARKLQELNGQKGKAREGGGCKTVFAHRFRVNGVLLGWLLAATCCRSFDEDVRSLWVEVRDGEKKPLYIVLSAWYPDREHRGVLRHGSVKAFPITGLH